MLAERVRSLDGDRSSKADASGHDHLSHLARCMACFSGARARFAFPFRPRPPPRHPTAASLSFFSPRFSEGGRSEFRIPPKRMAPSDLAPPSHSLRAPGTTRTAAPSRFGVPPVPVPRRAFVSLRRVSAFERAGGEDDAGRRVRSPASSPPPLRKRNAKAKQSKSTVRNGDGPALNNKHRPGQARSEREAPHRWLTAIDSTK